MQNLLPIHLGPDGVNQCEVASPFNHQVALLESGTVKIRVHGRECACIGGIGLVKADMPQGQKICGVKSQSANHPCRACMIGHVHSLIFYNLNVHLCRFPYYS